MTLRSASLLIDLDGLRDLRGGARQLAALVGGAGGRASIGLLGARPRPGLERWLLESSRTIWDFGDIWSPSELERRLSTRAEAQGLLAIGASLEAVAGLVAARAALSAGGAALTIVGLAADPLLGDQLDRAGADFICRDPAEALALRRARALAGSLSLVLLAFNEGPTLSRAIDEARRFGRRFARGHEIVVVDDGSDDDSAERLVELAAPDLRVVSHARNQGMGAGLRSGFAAARCDFVAPFPADRQVRPTALLPLLPFVGPRAAGVGYYETPHAGGLRALLSAGFRANLRWVGGLRVAFDGTYCFPRALLDTVDPRLTRSASFVYSYELLEQLRRAGCELTHRPVRSFARQAGTSKIANPRRVARVFGEIVASRARALAVRTGVDRVKLLHEPGRTGRD
jgi:hypothetical protein